MVATVDTEHSVRHALSILLRYILSATTAEQLQPFFQVLVAHLSCGLTHITDKIQVDALKLFDLVMAQFPQLFIPHAGTLLPLLGGLVSRQQAKYTATKRSSQNLSDSSLSSAPNSKLSSKTTRLDVFTQMCRFVGVLVGHYDRQLGVAKSRGGMKEAPIVDVLGGTLLTSKDGEVTPSFSSLVDLSPPIVQVAIVSTHGVELPQDAFSTSPKSSLSGHSTLTPRQASTSHLKGDAVFPDHSKLLEFVQSLVSLLLGSWLECSPSDVLVGRSGGTISADTITIMETVLNLLCSILKLVQRVDQAARDYSGGTKLMVTLCEKFSSDFGRHFLPYFPFGNVRSARRKLQYVTINLTLSNVFLLLLTGAKHPFRHTKTLTTLTSFVADLTDISKAMADSAQFTTACVNGIADSLPLFVDGFQRYGVPNKQQTTFFAGVLSLYHACHPQSAAKHTLIAAFFDLLAQNPQSAQPKWYVHV